MVGSYEHCIEESGAMRSVNILEKLNNYQLLETDSAYVQYFFVYY
jgi:hypothetical protein